MKTNIAEILDISTHTPLAGRDRRGKKLQRPTERFLLTRPLRGATNDHPTV